MSEVTRILTDLEAGRPQAAEELLPLVYTELRRLAAARMAQEPAGHTLQPTALVHEAWLKLAGSSGQQWNGRGHFFGAAAEAMRRILIDRARRRNRARHGHGLQRINLDGIDVAIATDDETLLRLDEALGRLAAESPEKARLVELRYFAGLAIPEAAEALGISPATAKRHCVATAASHERARDRDLPIRRRQPDASHCRAEWDRLRETRGRVSVGDASIRPGAETGTACFLRGWSLVCRRFHQWIRRALERP